MVARMHVVAGLVAVVIVAADVPAHADADRDWHAGLNVRTELGVHAVRLDGGVRLRCVDLIAVVDPWFWTDGELDLDFLVTRQLTASGYGVLAGWRPTSIAVADGHQLQETLLVGVVGKMPALGPVDIRFGLELAAVLVKHGGGLPTDTISFASAHDLGDNINFSLFLRIGHATAF